MFAQGLKDVFVFSGFGKFMEDRKHFVSVKALEAKDTKEVVEWEVNVAAGFEIRGGAGSEEESVAFHEEGSQAMLLVFVGNASEKFVEVFNDEKGSFAGFGEIFEKEALSLLFDIRRIEFTKLFDLGRGR